MTLLRVGRGFQRIQMLTFLGRSGVWSSTVCPSCKQKCNSQEGDGLRVYEILCDRPGIVHISTQVAVLLGFVRDLKRGE